MKLTLDIGATNTRILKARNYDEEKVEIIKTKTITSLQELLKTRKKNVKKLIIAAAGPKKDNKINLSNANLNIDKNTIENDLNIKTTLLNDLEAQAHYFKTKHAENTTIVAIGTGLGVAHIINKKIFPSETGHVKNQEGTAFEQLVSGKGLQNIHKKLTGKTTTSKKAIQNKHVRNEFEKHLAQILQTIALINLPKTIVLSGGVVQKNHEILNLKHIKKVFQTNKQKKILQNISILVNKEKHVGIKGCLTL